MGVNHSMDVLPTPRKRRVIMGIPHVRTRTRQARRAYKADPESQLDFHQITALLALRASTSQRPDDTTIRNFPESSEDDSAFPDKELHRNTAVAKVASRFIFIKYGVPLDGKITFQQFVDWYHSIPESERDDPAGWMLKIAFETKDELAPKRSGSVLDKHMTRIRELARMQQEELGNTHAADWQPSLSLSQNERADASSSHIKSHADGEATMIDARKNDAHARGSLYCPPPLRTCSCPTTPLPSSAELPGRGFVLAPLPCVSSASRPHCQTPSSVVTSSQNQENLKALRGLGGPGVLPVAREGHCVGGQAQRIVLKTLPRPLAGGEGSRQVTATGRQLEAARAPGPAGCSVTRRLSLQAGGSSCGPAGPTRRGLESLLPLGPTRSQTRQPDSAGRSDSCSDWRAQ